MRLFVYYALHSVKNQIRKLFKTWVMIFILICAVIGGLIGLGAAALSDLAEEDTAIEQESEDYEYSEDTDYSEWDEFADLAEDDSPFDREALNDLVELCAGLIILAVFLFMIYSADKSGSKIFLPADVNILFASPMKPQSVLLFRLLSQMGMIIFASIYLLFQIPNLVMNLSMSVWTGVALIAAWCLALITGQLIQVLLYTVCSTHPKVKERLRPAFYAIVAILVVGFLSYWKSGNMDAFDAAESFFNAPGTRWIPMWGWLKAFCGCAVEENIPQAAGYLAAIAVGIVALVYIIWNIKADFYEEAMHKSEETAELLARAKSEKSSGIVFVKRKKERSEKLRRDEMKHGWGANVFFFKSLYNRFRFAHLGYFTKTAETYLVAAVAVAAFCRFGLEEGGVVPLVMVLGAFVFFRTLGNPLEEDTNMDYFRLIPANTWSKVFWSLLGGTVNCLLDLLPAMIVGALVLGANPLVVLLWIPFVVSVDFFGTNVGAFINLSVPVSAGKTIKQIVQVMFIYFGLVPDIALLAIGAVVIGNIGVGAVLAAIFNVLLGFGFFAISPLFLEPK